MNRRKLDAYWYGKSVVVTGASSGLGWAIVEALAPYRIKFCLLSRRDDLMLELALSLKDTGSTFWIKSCDIRDRQQVYDAIVEFHRQAGRIDVVWANSGVAGKTSFSNWNWDVVDAILETNINGAIYTTMACLEKMMEQGSGTVVGVGSATSMRGLPGHGIYCLSKIGLAYFLESMAAEIPEIQFTIIHPGFVDTPINQHSVDRIWVISARKAAKIMINGVTHKKRVLIYPFRMRLLYHFVQILPSSVYVFLAHKAKRFYREND
ncbi:SDR family NAD(P)-dependent oxidoreductase [candidate division KSB1 bacterium]|nr:SDR family NAD(P)-dependent oxidoreductase [candidate division KSB1 bacterium]